MYGNGINNLLNGISLTKVLSGLNKGINFARQAIPIYKQIKPILSNSKSLVNMLNIINTPDNNISNNEIVDNIKKETSNDTLPIFFQ